MDIEHATEDDLQDIKKWFFKENMRIQQENTALTEAKAAFEAEKKDYEEQHEMARLKIQMVRRQLDKEKRLFDLKWKKLEEEVYRLALEKDDIAKARKELAAMEKTGQYEIFFVGVNSGNSLKKRYRDLLKIFHPDNLNGDTTTLQEINRQYDSLKKILL